MAPESRRWCRGSRLLVGASVTWLGVVLIRPVPTPVRLAVPAALLCAPVAVRETTGARVPRAAHRWVTATAAAALIGANR